MSADDIKRAIDRAQEMSGDVPGDDRAALDTLIDAARMLLAKGLET